MCHPPTGTRSSVSSEVTGNAATTLWSSSWLGQDTTHAPQDNTLRNILQLLQTRASDVEGKDGKEESEARVALKRTVMTLDFR